MTKKQTAKKHENACDFKVCDVDCIYALQNEQNRCLYICANKESMHFAHVISAGHPVCSHLEQNPKVL